MQASQTGPRPDEATYSCGGSILTRREAMLTMRPTVSLKRWKPFRLRFVSSAVAALALGLVLLPALPTPAESAPAAAQAPASYPLIANLTLGSDVVLTGTVRKISRVAGRDALSTPEGFSRHLMRVDVSGVLVAPRAIPGEITYVWDAPESVYGTRPKLKGKNVLLFLRAVPGNDRVYQLVAQNAQILSPGAAVETVRGIAADPIRASGYAHRVTGVVDATRMQRASDENFATHFLVETAEKGLMTVSVPEGTGNRTIRVMLPDSLGESRPLEPNSLVSYFLACGLPAVLPAPVLETAAALGDVAAVEADYQYLRDTVGLCQ